MTIEHKRQGGVAIEGQDLAMFTEYFDGNAAAKDRDYGLPLQLIDCGGLTLLAGRSIPVAAGRMCFQFDFANDGPAAVGNFVLGELPNNFIIRAGYLDVLTAVAGGTIALTAESAGDIFAVATPGAGIVEVIPKVENSATWVKTTAQRQLLMTVATGDLTAGKFNLFLEGDYSA